MVKLQHRSRRDGIIRVGGTAYELSPKGEVEVSEEHAAKMLQGACWRHAGAWEAARKAQKMPEATGGARRPRTPEELAAAAGAAGFTAAPKPKPEPEAEPAPESVPFEQPSPTPVTRRKKASRRR